MKKLTILVIVAITAASGFAQQKPKFPDLKGYTLGASADQVRSKITSEFPTLTWPKTPYTETVANTRQPLWHVWGPWNEKGKNPISFTQNMEGVVIGVSTQQELTSKAPLPEVLQAAFKKYGKPYSVYGPETYSGRESYIVKWAADSKGVSFKDADADKACDADPVTKTTNCLWKIMITADRVDSAPSSVVIKTYLDSPDAQSEAFRRAIGEGNSKASF